MISLSVGVTFVIIAALFCWFVKPVACNGKYAQLHDGCLAMSTAMAIKVLTLVPCSPRTAV